MNSTSDSRLEEEIYARRGYQSLGREDVFAIDDAGLRRGLRRFYGEDVLGDADRLAAILETWQPYRSVASLYLWAALDGGVSPG